MQKNAYLSIRLTPTERQRLDTWAAAGGRSAGGEVRYRLFSEAQGGETQMDTPSAASPDHRPPAEPLVVRNRQQAKAIFDESVTGLQSGTLPVGVTRPMTGVERAKAAQAGRDAILRGVKTK